LVAVTVVTNGKTEQILGDQAVDQATSPTHPVSIQEGNLWREWEGMQVCPPVKNQAEVDTVGEAVGRKLSLETVNISHPLREVKLMATQT
jgi:hypothetical protein